MGSSWNTLADWKSSPDGSGSSPASLSASDAYHINNHILRTPETTGTATFPGGLLRLSGANGKLAVKTYTATGLTIVPKLVSTGGKIESFSGGTQYVQVNHYENQSGSTTLHAQSGRTLKLIAQTLVGEGEMRMSGGGGFLLEITNAKSYAGDLHLVSGTLNFDNNLDSAGRLLIDTTGRVTLDQSVTFTGLQIGSVEYPVGTYTYAQLQNAHPAIFTSGNASGAITVRAPRTWYLSTSQPIGASWNTLSHWKSGSDGSGTVADSINPFDIYINQAADRVLRTPETTGTFGGGILRVKNGASLLLKAPAGHVSTIPVFDTEGTVTIANGFGGITQSLVVDDWLIASGTTSFTIQSSNTLNLSIDLLSGAGTLQTKNGGNYRLSIRGGNAFTGKLLHFSGSLRFDSQIGTRGNFTLESGGSVTLNHPGFFTSAKIQGTNLSPGYHSYASLKAAFPSRFPSGSSSAFLAIYSPDTTGPQQMFGVNLAGGEFGGLPGNYGWDYIYPNAAEFDYYHSKGLNLIRLPFLWERLQPTLNAPLNSQELARIDTVIGYASAHGMKVILDMHNYARRKENGTTYLIGTGPVSLSSFADAWRRIADHYKGNSTIHAYGIMNEPHSTGGTWPDMAQAAVNAIRTVDLTHYVLVGGDTWSNAVGWRSKNPNLDTQDPVGRLIYEAHCYFDNDNSGTYNQSYDGEGAYPEVGVDRVREFVEWLEERGARGFIGEYGVPGNDPRWLTVLDNFLAYIQAHGLSGTYWAGGPWWGSYALSCEPTNNFTADRPQMSVLEDYTGEP